MILEPEIVARGWLDLHTRSMEDYERALSTWAEDIIREATYHDANYALRIVMALHVLTRNTEWIAIFAAGPLEDLLARQGQVVIGDIEEASRLDPGFAHALGGVWRNSIDEETWARVKVCRTSKGWDISVD